MLKFINLKKLTAKTLIGILVAGTLVTQSGTKKAVASACDNNGHGNNMPGSVTLSSGDVITVDGYDPTNPGAKKNQLKSALKDGKTSSNGMTITYSNGAFELSNSQADYVLDNIPDIEKDCDSDNNGIPDYLDDENNSSSSTTIIPKLWGIDEDDGQLFAMTNYTDKNSMIDYGLLKWNDNGTIKTIGQDMEAMTLDEDGTMYIALDSRRLTGGGDGATLLKFNIQDATTTGNNVVEIVGNMGISFDHSSDNVSGLSIDPQTGELVALLKNYTSGGSSSAVDKLYVISKTDGSLVREIGSIEGLGEVSRKAEDIEHAPDGSLYVTDNYDDHTYKVNTNTGAIIAVTDNNQKDGLDSSSVKFEALGWDFANNRLIGFDDNDESLAKLALENGNNFKYYDTSSIGLTDVEGVDFVPTTDGEPLIEVTYPDPDPDPDPTPNDSDADNNGILDDDELPGDVDGDGIANYLDVDDDGDNIADVMELYTPEAISDTGTKTITMPGVGFIAKLPNPPETNITPSEAINTDGTDNPDYQDTDSDNDTISDKDEAGDNLLSTAPVNTDTASVNPDSKPDYLDDDSDGDNISDAEEAGDNDLSTAPDDSDYYQGISDGIADFQDFDSDNNGILDIDESDGDLDLDGKDNYKDLDDDGDKILDIIEIGSNPANPLNSDANNDGEDYQDLNSDDDLWSDVEEGVQSTSSQGTNTVTLNYLAGSPFQFILKDFKLDDTENADGHNDAEKANMTMIVTKGANGTVTVNGSMTGLEYQVPTYND